MNLITPYSVCNDGENGDGKWYAIDYYGASAGPYDSKEEADEKVRTLPQVFTRSLVQQATHDQTEKDLMRLAYLVISQSNYAVDIASLNGFALGIGIHPGKLEGWLREKLGDKFPTELPDYWIYAKGI